MRTTNALLTLSLALAGLPALAGPDPFKPIGTLDAANKWVRTGNFAQLDWQITYPLHVSDLVIPDPTGRVTTKEDVRMKIRVAGVAFQSGSQLLPTALNVKFNSGPWMQLFEGTSDDVQPDENVFDQVVPAGTTIDFGAQGQRADGNWYDPRSTAEASIAVTGLLNGDSPPSYAPAYDQGDIESFLTGLIGYGDPNNGADNGPRVTIGPRDMIYLFECASTDPGDWWFDMQDVVVVVTYETVNGNGNGPAISQTNRDRRNNQRGPSRPNRGRPQIGFHLGSEPAPGDDVHD